MSYGGWTSSNQSNENVQESLAHKVIRLHVVANSDEEVDQELKIKVKNAVVEELRQELTLAKEKKKAEDIIRKKTKKLENYQLNLKE
jgi:stage II sporulation protein R